MTHKKKWWWRVSRYKSWRNSRANRHHTGGINRKQLDEDKHFHTGASQWGRPRSSCARKQIDSRQFGRRRVLINQDFPGLLLWHGPSMIRALRLKQMVEGGLVPYCNIFGEMKKTSQTEITMYFHKSYPTCAPLSCLPPLHLFASASPETARPPPPLPQPAQHEGEMKAFLLQWSTST